MCSQWRTFEQFYHDMGDRPPGKTLDRIDPNRGYSPENCRWATPREQSRNQRMRIPHKHVVYEDVVFCLSELSEYLGVPLSTLSKRVKKFPNNPENWSKNHGKNN